MHQEHTRNFLLGKFKNPDAVIASVKELQEEGYSIFDVYTPFPVHGLDRALGIKRSRLSVAAFLFGGTGTICAVAMMLYMGWFDWPMDVGGKPLYMGPAAIPVTFELTVLFSAFGMVLSFFAVNKLFPGKKPTLMDQRVTDDVLVIAIDKSTFKDANRANEIFNRHGAFEISDKIVHDEFLAI